MRRIMILFILLLVSLPIAAGLASEPPQGTSRRLEWDKVYYANVPNESNPSNYTEDTTMSVPPYLEWSKDDAGHLTVDAKWPKLTVIRMLTDFSFGSSMEETLNPGDIEIRLPSSIFRGSDGSIIDLYKHGIARLGDASADGAATDFRYTIDPVTNEFVITNINAVRAGRRP